MNDEKTMPIVVVVGLTAAQVMSALHNRGARLLYNDEVQVGDRLAVETDRRVIFNNLPMFAHFNSLSECASCFVDETLDVVIVVGIPEHDVMHAVFDVRHAVMVCSKATSDDEMGIEVLRRLITDGSHLPVVMNREGYSCFVGDMASTDESTLTGGTVDDDMDDPCIGVEFVDEFREQR